MNLTIIAIEEITDKTKSPLKVPAAKVTFPLSYKDKALIAIMKKKLYEMEGVGLAAPQVNVSKNIALIYIPKSASLLREDVRTYSMHAIINADYEPVEESGKIANFEGCYSVKSVYGKVSRYKTIKVKYQDEKGNLITKTESGFYARVLQHEIDHLNGILITDRLTPECLQGTFKEMINIRRNELSKEKRIHFDALLKQKNIIFED